MTKGKITHVRKDHQKKQSQESIDPKYVYLCCWKFLQHWLGISITYSYDADCFWKNRKDAIGEQYKTRDKY